MQVILVYQEPTPPPPTFTIRDLSIDETYALVTALGCARAFGPNHHLYEALVELLGGMVDVGRNNPYVASTPCPGGFAYEIKKEANPC